MDNLPYVTKCSQCGYIQVTYLNDGEEECTACMNEEDFKIYFPEIDIPESSAYCCDNCVNHWAIDKCDCGSGEMVGECDCGSKTPMQTINVKRQFVGWVR